jgi:hypothetical protein
LTQDAGVYFHFSRNYQVLEEFFTTKSNRTKGSQYKKQEGTEADFILPVVNFFDFVYFAVKNSSNSGNFATLAHAR